MPHISRSDFSPELKAAIADADRLLSTIAAKTEKCSIFLCHNYYNQNKTIASYLDIISPFLDRLESLIPILEQHNPINPKTKS